MNGVDVICPLLNFRLKKIYTVLLSKDLYIFSIYIDELNEVKCISIVYGNLSQASGSCSIDRK